ncbi:MAG: nuclear transport factor 2 family protein [Actinobacteria bacterium]|nr:nuclear transport factor 2 family protein [Actinomycetota bacterium]
MPHANEDVIRRLFDEFRRGDREAAVALFAEDAVFRYPGPGPLHGDHRGRAGILRFWGEQDRLSGGFRPEMVDLVAGDRNVFLLVRMVSEDDRTPWMRVVVYEVSDGVITGARVFEDDPAAAAALFSG